MRSDTVDFYMEGTNSNLVTFNYYTDATRFSGNTFL
jgi:hypothetical protein